MPVWALSLALAVILAAPPKTIHLEAEQAQLVGTVVAARRRGFSGSGYVTGFEHEGDKIVFSVQAQAGIYNARIRYSAPSGEKGYELVVNGSRLSGMFPRTGDVFATHSAGKVELKAGPNTLEIAKGWGWFDIDYLELVPTAVNRSVRKPPKTLADPKATARAHALLGYLLSLYGSKTLSGQYEPSECDYIRSVTGKTPAILGGDLMDYSPSRIPFGGMPQGTTEAWIRSAKAGQILTLSWHWNAPADLLDKTFKNARGEEVDARWYKGFYTYATTFDLQYALDNPDSEAYHLILRDMDAIAAQLKKLADADIPVLWRPLHEAEGGWFWWGAKGPNPFVRLWRLLFDRLTKVHGLHNLIWVYTGSKAEWYPGDAYVDIVGIDAYPADPGDPLSSTWDDLLARFAGKKLLALTEFGGVPDVEKMARYGVRWSYFVSWTGGLGPRKMSSDALKRIYDSAAVVNRQTNGSPSSKLTRVKGDFENRETGPRPPP